jgi:hypothetical protein
MVYVTPCVVILTLYVSFSTLLLERGGKESITVSFLPGRLPVHNSAIGQYFRDGRAGGLHFSIHL